MENKEKRDRDMTVFYGTEEMENKEKRDRDITVFYGTEEVAAALRCSVPVARGIMHRPDFPLIQIGKNLRVSKDAFEKWAMERRT